MQICLNAHFKAKHNITVQSESGYLQMTAQSKRDEMTKLWCDAQCGVTSQRDKVDGENDPVKKTYYLHLTSLLVKLSVTDLQLCPGTFND